MSRSSEFNGAISGRNVIAGSHFETGATMNNYFGGDPRMQGGPSRKREPFSTVPFAPDRDFVDRPEILAWIRDKCAGPGARTALVGLGGVGKSQLAIRYAHSVRDASPQTFVLWVHASTRARFEEAYRGIADKLELPERNDPKVDVLRLVSNWLCNETNGKWMMIVDNADAIEVFYPKQTRKMDESSPPAPAPLATYLPQSRNGSILITSRSKDAAARLAGGHKYIKEVHAMDESQAFDLFRGRLGRASNEEGATALLLALGHIPLAITQAAAFINRRGRMTASGYLNDFRENDKKRESLLNWDSGDLRRDESASNSVVLTWQMSFEYIREQRRSAADLLSIMSFFNPQGIPEWILRSYSKSVAKSSDESKADSAFDEDLDTLQAYSLIRATAHSSVYDMHALVHFCTRVWLSTFSNLQKWNREFLALMAREFPLGDFKDWSKCQQLLPHVESLYKRELLDDESVKGWGWVLNAAARYMWSALGRYDEAEKLNRRALEGIEKELGKQHPDTLASVSSLALVLQDQGKYDEAEKLNRRALEGREKELGKQHPNTLASVNNLASVLQNQGKHDEAEKLQRRALEGREKELGKQHPATLESVSNLASVLQNQGKYDEAKKLHQQALEGREKELGKQHHNTLASVSNLASVLRDQRKYDEAEKLNRQALKGYEKELGKQHPDTLASVNNLALVLQNQGKYDEAEKLHRRALEGREKELGQHHPSTVTSIYNLAYILHKRKQYEEALRLYQKACDGYKQKLGTQHPATIACLNDFSAMQQEAKHEMQEQSGTLINEGKAALRETSARGLTSLSSSEITTEPANSRQESKQDSLYARLERKRFKKA